MGIHKSRDLKSLKDRANKGNIFSDYKLENVKVVEEGKKAKDKIKTDFIWGRI